MEGQGDRAGNEHARRTSDSGSMTSAGAGRPIGKIDGIAPNGTDGWFVADHVSGPGVFVDAALGLATEVLASGFAVSDVKKFVPALDQLLAPHMYEEAVAAYRCIRGT